MDIVQKSKRGGSRPGAGRKPTGKPETIAVRIPIELLPIIEQMKKGNFDNSTAIKEREIEQLKAHIAVLENTLQETKQSTLSRIKSLETTNKQLSTKLANANEELKTHRRLLEKAETKLREKA